MWKEKAEMVFGGLGDIGRKMLIENSTTFGRKWLSSIPYFQPLRLTDYDISTGLHFRTLAAGSRRVCNWCGDGNKLGHDEVSMRRNRWAIRRHDEVKRAMFKALVSLENTIAIMEPDTIDGRGNDIRIEGRGPLGRLDFDIKTKTTPPPSQGLPSGITPCHDHSTTSARSRRRRSRMPLGEDRRSWTEFVPWSFPQVGWWR